MWTVPKHWCLGWMPTTRKILGVQCIIEEPEMWLREGGGALCRKALCPFIALSHQPKAHHTFQIPPQTEETIGFLSFLPLLGYYVHIPEGPELFSPHIIQVRASQWATWMPAVCIVQGDLKNLIRAPGSWSFQCPPSVSVLGLSAQLDTTMLISSSSTVTTHTTSRGPAMFSLTNLIPLVLIPPVSHKHCWHANIFTLAQHVPSILSKYPVQLSNNRVQGPKKDFLNQNFNTCS